MLWEEAEEEGGVWWIKKAAALHFAGGVTLLTVVWFVSECNERLGLGGLAGELRQRVKK